MMTKINVKAAIDIVNCNLFVDVKKLNIAQYHANQKINIFIEDTAIMLNKCNLKNLST